MERVVRDAFARAQRRPRRKLTLVHKTNVLVHAGAVWSRLVAEVGREFPDVAVDYLHIDAATIFMTTDPSRFDVIVTDNLFGDIITDLAAAITGGIGLAASGNINPDRTAPSMFEPVHGSAPDIAGQQKADPTAAILSASLLLDHLGHADAAAAVEAAVVDASPPAPRAPRRTSEIGDDVAAQVAPDRRGRLTCLPWRSAPPSRPSPSTTRLAEILANPGSACTSPTTCSRSSGRRPTAGTARGSRRTARSPSTRPPPCCTTRRRPSRA